MPTRRRVWDAERLGRVAVRRRAESVVAVFREPRLRRVELAWFGHYLAEWTQFVALSIYAYRTGGATGVGLFGVLRMGAAAVALPFGAALVDRYPRQRVLFLIQVARGATFAATTVALASGSPRALVFALAMVAAVLAAPVRPATLALVPLLARTAEELVAANVSSSTMEGLGTLVGPLIGGGLTAAFAPSAAVGAAAAVSFGCAFVVLGVHREGEIGSRRSAGQGVLAELWRGARTLRRESEPRLIVALFGSQALVRGLLNVFLTVAALQLLGTGARGVGWLNAALGAGGLLGAVVTVGLVTRRRLAGPFALALVLWGLPITLIGIWPSAGGALVCVAIIGIGNALIDVAGFTLLQRTVDEHVLGRVFGVFEIVATASVAAGSAFASIGIAQVGLRPAMIASGLLLPAVAVVSLPRLRAIDDASTVPERALAAVSMQPLFAPLPATMLERLAFRTREETAPAGKTIIQEGTAGDTFYVIDTGEVEVTQAGRHLARLGSGDHFGEIALLHDAPRTATCTALTSVELYAIDREALVAAVSSDLRSAAFAEASIADRLAALQEDPGDPTPLAGEGSQ